MRFLFTNALRSLFIGGGIPAVTFFSPLRAQPVLYSLQAHLAQAASLGENHRNPFSVMINPASIASFRKVTWAFGGEQRFLAPGWTSLTVAGIMPVTRGSWSLLVAQEGLPMSVDQLGMITHARVVSRQALVGVSLGINRRKAGAFTAVLAPAMAAGFTYALSSEWEAGFSFTQFMGQGVTHVLPGHLSFLRYMLGYHPSEKFLLALGVVKESSRAAMGSAAICYRPTSKAAFRIGFSGAPSLCWFGLVLGIGKKVSIQVYTGFYSLVGVSNGVSVFSDPTVAKAELPSR
jgi:hypothetical protein